MSSLWISCLVFCFPSLVFCFDSNKKKKDREIELHNYSIIDKQKIFNEYEIINKRTDINIYNTCLFKWIFLFVCSV